MNDLNLILVLVMGGIIVVGLISNFIKESLLPSAPLLMVIFGIIIGPNGFDFINISHFGSQYLIMEQASIITLAISLMGVALRIPTNFLKKNFKAIAVILLIIMPLMFLSSGMMIYIILGLPFWVAMLIGASITPTDPVVSSAIVTGTIAERIIPRRIRNFISFESGANDGLALPFVALSLIFFTQINNPLSYFILDIFLYKLVVATLFGLVIGYLFGYLLKKAVIKGIIERTYFLSYAIAISLLTVSASELFGFDSVFVVFVAGLSFSRLIRNTERSEILEYQESVNHFFTLPIFILIGITIPWAAWSNIGWIGILLCIMILLFKRIPFILALRSKMEVITCLKDSLYVGWFGPIAVAAIYYLSSSVILTGLTDIWDIGTLIVFASIIAHGLSDTVLTRLYR